MLDFLFVFSPDILECSQTPNPCSQYCAEEPGSYSCICDQTGYQLDVDQKTCIGKSTFIDVNDYVIEICVCLFVYCFL